MADSDDDYERRRSREKFQKERPEPHNRDRDRRKDFDRNRTRSDGNSWARGRRENYPSGGDRRRDRYSNSPPHKRRRDWDEGGYPEHHAGPPRGYGPAPYPAGPGWGPHGGDLRSHLSAGGPPGGHFPAPAGGPGSRPIEGDVTLTQPPMQPFKRFLANQDDSISDEEAVKRYNQYKLDFKKQQINEFFLNHKDEEWFRTKYHPEDGSKRKDDLNANLMCRKDTFMTLYDLGKINTPLDISNATNVINVLDSAVVLMEGGSAEDLASLDLPVPSGPSTTQAGGEAQSRTDDGETPASPSDKKRRKKSKKRRKVKSKKNPNASSGSDSNSTSSSSSDSDSSESYSDSEGELKPSKKRKRRGLTPDGELEEGESKDSVILPIKFLHRTQSIFIRTLAPTITKHEVETMCKKYPGYMRVALQDPSADKKFYRRGWVTFDKSVNIKDICWNMSNIRLRDCELGAIVNRDLKQRVRPVSGLVNHKQAVQTYIKLAARVIQNADNRQNIWEDDEEKEDHPEKLQKHHAELGLVTKNPIMKGITDFLVDEAESLEDELLGAGIEGDAKKSGGTGELQFDMDKRMTAALDRMVWYMRIVYSVDFYNAIEYPNEHEMPHRCGIVHARGVVPEKAATQSEMNDFINHFETKVKPFTDAKRVLDDTDCDQLGKKEPEQEVEKFITANTQKLGEDKYLCPLSGKKFKGPEFVRKHIQSKHNEKVAEVKLEARYFNNYLEDAKRPALPEHPSNTARPRIRGPPPDMAPPPNFSPRGPMMGPPRMPSRGGYHGGFDSGGGGYGGGRGGFGRPDPYNAREPRRGLPSARGYPGGNRDGRSIVGYQDLDAPDDDIF